MSAATCEAVAEVVGEDKSLMAPKKSMQNLVRPLNSVRLFNLN